MYRIKEKLEVRPILKWAGGKTQLLPELLSRIPRHFTRYVEPFFGGGALFFALQPDRALISDSNPELVNLYRQVAVDVESVIDLLRGYRNEKDFFYETRDKDWSSLSPSEAAARMIYLNRTCFNGLYRVNRNGDFNVPFGAYRNPLICDAENLRKAAEVLKRAEIRCADYLDVLDADVTSGDFVFLDPPYVPVGKYGDFKRYTKEQFRESDHRNLAAAVARMRNRGCMGVLTNSDHPLVKELYADFPLVVRNTKRNISCKSASRTGADVIIEITPGKKSVSGAYSFKLPGQCAKFPMTRFMGSKRKLLPAIFELVSRLEFESVLDLFSGSGVVSYLFKAMGKRVVSCDHMHMAATFSKAMVENNGVLVDRQTANGLLSQRMETDRFVERTFAGLYFTDDENRLIDTLRANIKGMPNEYMRAVAMAALIRACTKKRPRGLFTYTGLRYDDGRKDLRKSLAEQFLDAIDDVNRAIFDNGKENRSLCCDSMTARVEPPDLVYVDPPYFTPKSDNEYVRRYHFLEGLARSWRGVSIQEETTTKKFKSYPTPFSTREGAASAFEEVFRRYRHSAIVVSYSSNSLPTKDEIASMLGKYKEHVEVTEIDYRYFFGNRADGRVKRNNVSEYLFMGY